MGNCRSLSPPQKHNQEDLIRFANGIKYSHLPLYQQHVIGKSIIDAVKRNQQEYERQQKQQKQQAKETVIISHRCIVPQPPTPVDSSSMLCTMPYPKSLETIKAEQDARRRAYNMIFSQHPKS